MPPKNIRFALFILALAFVAFMLMIAVTSCAPIRDCPANGGKAPNPDSKASVKHFKNIKR